MSDDDECCEIKRSHKTIDIFSLEGKEMAPAYKLTYFNVKALGEPIRMLFKYGGIDFEDNRIEKELWPQLKEKTPFGQLPTLEHDGKIINQSTAITRYVAKQVKLIGNDDWENLEIDAIVDTITDVRTKLAVYHYEQDEKVKESREKPILKEFLPFALEKLDKIVEQNKGYFALGRLTWADILFVGLLDYLNVMAKQDITANYKNLETVKNNVLGIAAIKEWIAARPVTEL